MLKAAMNFTEIDSPDFHISSPVGTRIAVMGRFSAHDADPSSGSTTGSVQVSLLAGEETKIEQNVTVTDEGRFITLICVIQSSGEDLNIRSDWQPTSEFGKVTESKLFFQIFADF